MQFPDPSEEIQKRASQPLYEFVANDLSQPVSSPVIEEAAAQASEAREAHSVMPDLAAEEGQPPTEEEIRQGLAYPPPPSFYQHFQASSHVQPPSINNRFPPPMSAGYVPGATATQAAPLPPPQAPAKRSRKWIWIIVAVLGTALLASCGLCGWATYSIFSSTFQQVAGSITVIENYYTAVEAQNYTTAYSYLDPQGTISGLTQEQFVQRARALDMQYGRVLSFTPGSTALPSNGTSGTNFSQFTITINVRRAKLSYIALLTLSKVDGKWKIVDFDRI